jgi:hypothetical protein
MINDLGKLTLVMKISLKENSQLRVKYLPLKEVGVMIIVSSAI